eukprot:scaffold8943_cov213-Amphora_coffeaeformis.AAC.3
MFANSVAVRNRGAQQRCARLGVRNRGVQQRCARLGENIFRAAILLWDKKYKNYLRHQKL